MRFINTRVHGVLDYALGVVLIAAPYLFDFAPGAQSSVPITLGIALIVYSALTDYELGLFRVIPMNVHLGLDVLGGAILALSPWLFGFSEDVWAPHLILGLIEVGAGLFTETAPRREAAEVTEEPRRRAVG